MKTLVLLLFFLGGLLGTDGFREALGADSSMVTVEEAEDQRWEIDPTVIESYEPDSFPKVYLEWNESPFFRGHIAYWLGPAGDPSQPLLFAQGSLGETEPDKKYTLLDKGEKPFPDTSQKESSKYLRDWKGIGRDTAFYLGYQALFAAILLFMPESVSGWSEDYKRATIDHWEDNVRNPVWDTDQWWINYIFHPYWGAIYYTRARERGFGEIGSFSYSFLLSFLYEFGIEAFFEPPSYNDLIVTPVGGYLVGKYIFEPIRIKIKAKPQRRWYDHFGIIATDPLGALNGVFEKLFGVQSDIRVQFHPPALGRQMIEDPFEGSSLKWKEGKKSDRQGVHLQFHFYW